MIDYDKLNDGDYVLAIVVNYPMAIIYKSPNQFFDFGMNEIPLEFIKRIKPIKSIRGWMKND